jgi:hypothetical protein
VKRPGVLGLAGRWSVAGGRPSLGGALRAVRGGGGWAQDFNKNYD